MSELQLTSKDQLVYHRSRAKQEKRQADASDNPIVSLLHNDLASQHLVLADILSNSNEAT